MRRFVLVRDIDVSGISGEGAVVWGIEFPDGVCAYRWNSPHKTSCLADCIEDIETIHGHNGATRVVWLDSPQAKAWQDLVSDVESPEPAEDGPVPPQAALFDISEAMADAGSAT